VTETLNDVHSRLNETIVQRIARPTTVDGLRDELGRARADRLPVAIAGARHSMGGQQLATQGVVIDMTSMRQVRSLDAERGIVEVDAGVDWHGLIDHLVMTQAGAERQWGIVQKPTGADGLTIGGSLSSNVHGRGLRLRPMIQDIESFDLLDGHGTLRTCSRDEDPELFRLAIGGYGLMGVVTSVRLRLAPRHLLVRNVEWIDVDDLARLFDERIAEGYVFGDCQFSIDSGSGDFLDGGIFSCYRPADPDAVIPDGQRALSIDDWKRLLFLTHTNKAAALEAYRTHYLATSGQLYWSDLHQRSEYIGGYHAALDAALGATTPSSEMITELYVPPDELAGFMHAAAEWLREVDANVVYGTIRLIERDGESFLPWARDRFGCVIFNLHVTHDEPGISRAAVAFRGLIDLAIERGGSYYLTYHRWATPAQLERCYPAFRAFRDKKSEYDADGLFVSDWFRHYAVD
jgi:FAD/FMN-containing dehydrogenase